MTNHNDHESAFLTPDDDPAMQDNPLDAALGPIWWEGEMPVAGINSLADLECYLNWRRNHFISLVWSAPVSLRKFGEALGSQAGRNAVRWLDRHGDTQPPELQSTDLSGPLEIESSLNRILRHIRDRQSTPANVAAKPDDNATASETPLPTQNAPVKDSHEVECKCEDFAYAYYELAMSQGSKLKTVKDTYDWLKDNPAHVEGYDLPSPETFERYVRLYRKDHGLSKNTPRQGRTHGRSIVRPSDIE